jgi:hypothetical protein
MRDAGKINKERRLTTLYHVRCRKVVPLLAQFSIIRDKPKF